MWGAEAVWHGHVSHVLWLNSFEMWPLTILSLHLIHPVISCRVTPPPSPPFSLNFPVFKSLHLFFSAFVWPFISLFCCFRCLINFYLLCFPQWLTLAFVRTVQTVSELFHWSDVNSLFQFFVFSSLIVRLTKRNVLWEETISTIRSWPSFILCWQTMLKHCWPPCLQNERL